MRIQYLALVAAGLLAGCSERASHQPAAAAAQATGASTTTDATRVSTRAQRGFAALPDRGDLLAYDSHRKTLHAGAYTLHPVDLSEQHALNAMAAGRELVVTGPDGQPIRLRYARHVEHPDGNWTWIGRPSGARAGIEAIITFGEKAVFGTIPWEGHAPLRLNIASGRAWLIETDNAVLATLDNTGTRPRGTDYRVLPKGLRATRGDDVAAAGPVTASATTQGATAVTTTIDALIGYTSTFATRLGGQSQANTRLTFMVDVANQAYANSLIPTRVRLVRTMQVNYPDTTLNDDALYDLSGVQCTETGGGLSCTPVGQPASLQPLIAARDQYGADLVSLVRVYNNPENGGCGIAWLLGAGRQPITVDDADGAMSVVSDSSGTLYNDGGYYCRDETLAHEFGHNLGSAHDIETAKGTDGVLDASDYGRYTYSFGQKTTVGAGNFYTVMSYGDSGQTLYRVFSNPRITSCGGYACGITDQVDNARSITDTSPIIATFRAAVDTQTTRKLLKQIDVNGNGYSDLFFFSHSLGRVATWFMNGASQVATSSSVVSGGYSVADTADFNADKKGDLLLADTLGNLFIGTSNGTQFTVAQLANGVPAGYELLGAGDINGNGTGDILLREKATGRVIVWYMSGTTRVAYNTHTIDASLNFVGVGDFNGDKRQDILWSNAQNQVYMSLSAGTSFTTSYIGLAYQAGYVLPGAQDVNGDGKSDVLLFNASLNRLVVWYMNGTTRISFNTTASTAGSVLVGKGDFDHNGKGDLAWRMPGSTAIRLFLSAGTTFTVADVAQIPQAGWQVMDMP
ncbi:reprolysin-like metallopeptidase [Lysobacter fragariae]